MASNSNGKAKCVFCIPRSSAGPKTSQSDAYGKVGIVKSINKDEFHAIIQSCRSGAACPAHSGEIPIYLGYHSISDEELIKSYSLLVDSTVISVDPNYYRLLVSAQLLFYGDGTEVACPDGNLLIGDPSKAKQKLGWQAETNLEELVKLMVGSDFQKVLEKGY